LPWLKFGLSLVAAEHLRYVADTGLACQARGENESKEQLIIRYLPCRARPENENTGETAQRQRVLMVGELID
jgi:hypothetical protein